MVEKETGLSEGIFWMAMGTVICVLALQFDLGSFRGPGPGFVAFLAGIFIACVGAVMALSRGLSRRRGKDLSPPAQTAIAWGRLAYTMGLLVAYAIMMDPVGYIVSTYLVMFGLFFDWEQKNWFWSAFFAVAASLVSYLVFEIWLHCQLPRGIFPWW